MIVAVLPMAKVWETCQQRETRIETSSSSVWGEYSNGERITLVVAVVVFQPSQLRHTFSFGKAVKARFSGDCPPVAPPGIRLDDTVVRGGVGSGGEKKK